MKHNTHGFSVLLLIGIIITVGVIGFGGWYVLSRDKIDQSKVITPTDSAEDKDAEPTDDTPDPYKDWLTYNWAPQATSFKYPADWFVAPDASNDRVHIRNVQNEVTKEDMPATYQNMWLSADTVEAAAEREAAIKQGESSIRQISGTVTASTIMTGSRTINTYEYQTIGGATIEAYWTGKDGRRYFATTPTELGEPRQTDSVKMLKQVLPTLVIK